jgi:ribulose-5-phosphate 4-epimerase/fuculose-1-phosphate aldolase
MTGRLTVLPPARVTPMDAFRRLFENEFITLEGFAISCRLPEGMGYLDESSAVERLLADEPPMEAPAPTNPSLLSMHRAMYQAWPDVQGAVSGRPLHLRALLAEGLPLPAPTSMMRKRGVTDLQEHLVGPAGFIESNLQATLSRARETAAAHAMKHVLLVASDGTVHVAGPSMEEAMAHYSNVGFAARVECIRVEEVMVHRG